MLALSAAIGIGALHGPAVAATGSGAFAVRGIGAQSCKNITAVAAGKKADELVQLSSAWVAGYVSQYNRATSNTYEAIPIVDNVVLGKLAINVCRSNPDTLFEAVAASLVASFSRGALSNESPDIELKNGNSRAVLRRGVVRHAETHRAFSGGKEQLDGGGLQLGDIGLAGHRLFRVQEVLGDDGVEFGARIDDALKVASGSQVSRLAVAT